MVFNADAWRLALQRAFGLRVKRSIQGKEVIIREPDYVRDNAILLDVTHRVSRYADMHRLKTPPNVVKAFFKYAPDHEIEQINVELEGVINDLSNTRDNMVLHQINQYPVLIVKAHTRPFERRWLNIAVAFILPLGMFFYFRMWRFRIRLARDLKQIKFVNANIINHTERLMKKSTETARGEKK